MRVRAYIDACGFNGIEINSNVESEIKENLVASLSDAFKSMKDYQLANDNYACSDLKLNQIVDVREITIDKTYRFFLLDNEEFCYLSHENKYYNYIDKYRIIISPSVFLSAGTCLDEERHSPTPNLILLDWDVVLSKTQAAAIYRYYISPSKTDPVEAHLITKDKAGELRDTARRRKKEAEQEKLKKQEEYLLKLRKEEKEKELISSEHERRTLLKQGKTFEFENKYEDKVKVTRDFVLIEKTIKEYNRGSGEYDSKLVELKFGISGKRPVSWLDQNTYLHELKWDRNAANQYCSYLVPFDFYLEDYGVFSLLSQKRIRKLGQILGYDKEYTFHLGKITFKLKIEEHAKYDRVSFNGVFVRRQYLPDFVNKLYDLTTSSDPVKDLSDLGKKLELLNLRLPREQMELLEKSGFQLTLKETGGIQTYNLQMKVDYDKKTKHWSVSCPMIGKGPSTLPWPELKNLWCGKRLGNTGSWMKNYHSKTVSEFLEATACVNWFKDRFELFEVFKTLARSRRVAEETAKKLMQKVSKEQGDRVKKKVIAGSVGFLVTGASGTKYFVEVNEDAKTYKNPDVGRGRKGHYLCIHHTDRANMSVYDQVISRILLLLNDNEAKTSVYTLE